MAVKPSLLRAFTSAPRSSSSLIVSSEHITLAQCSAVVPASVLALASAPCHHTAGLQPRPQVLPPWKALPLAPQTTLALSQHSRQYKAIRTWSRSRLVHLRWPCEAAKWRAVRPRLSCTSTVAFCNAHTRPLTVRSPQHTLCLPDALAARVHPLASNNVAGDAERCGREPQTDQTARHEASSSAHPMQLTKGKRKPCRG